MGTTRGVGASHEQRRAEIVDAALSVTAEHGIASVTQSRVAAAAGVSAGRVQHYFPSMTALLTEAFDQLNAAGSARIRDLVGQELSDAPPRRVLEVVLGELIPHDDTSRAHLQFRQSFTALGLQHHDVASRLREQYRHLHREELAGLIRRDQTTGRIEPTTDPVAAGIALAALAEGLAYYVLIGAMPAEDARRQTLDSVAMLYRGGSSAHRDPGVAHRAQRPSGPPARSPQ